MEFKNFRAKLNQLNTLSLLIFTVKRRKEERGEKMWPHPDWVKKVGRINKADEIR